MDSYVVRVYRREAKKTCGLAGVVEYAGAEENGTMPFRSSDELLEILSGLDVGQSRERRVTARLKLRLPLRVTGTTIRGKRFTEESTLEDLSASGASFYIKNRVAMDKKLTLLIDPERSGLSVKVSVVRRMNGGSKRGVGVSFEKKI